MKEKELRGLTSAEAEQRKAEGKVNTASTVKTKSIKRIFIDNICTVFNGINVLLFILLMVVGSYKNLLFIGVVLFNTVIGIVQEIRSKKSVDKLTILTESKLNVLRDGEIVELSKDELVLDDIILLSRGNQVPADCILVDGECSANESLLTGESDLIAKKLGDELLSGSFIASGNCKCRVNRVGADSYAAKINNEAKYIKKNDSQILKAFKTIINICSVIIFPVGILMFVIKYFVQQQMFNDTVISTVGALVGMIPGGMILLTSTVLAVSVIRLAKKKVLVNEMYCIETLARVDVICLDKTGTLTAEIMNVHDTIPLDCEKDEIMTALSSIAHVDEVNATAEAVHAYTKDIEPLQCKHFTPFSSETKWSGGEFSNGRTYIMGAAEFVFSDKEKYAKVYQAIDEVKDTVRILVLAKSVNPLTDKTLPDDLIPMALILIKDQLRDNVQETVNYFKEQGVTLKVISGDSVKTVQNIAKDCGIEGAENAVDMSTVTTDEELAEVAERCNVFGRVTPAQKKKLLIALKEKGHKVAMTGDGVNDVLALKEADCSVAMAAGSEAARNVSQLVLVNNDFACMPQVVAEGRRSINNIERSSSLYLVKTMYSILLSLFFLFSHHIYPFEPIQLSLIGALTVGFPSFVLALQPNKNIVRGNFTYNIITRAAPAAICIALNIIVTALLSDPLGLSHAELSTMAVYTTSLIGLMLIVRLCIPFNALRGAMLALSTAGIVIATIFFRDFFKLTALSQSALIMQVITAVVIIVLFNLLYHFADKMIEKHKRESSPKTTT
ncbi:HAD-IC family P-type ATPase [Roseburia sp. MSJ-14]|uniref:HAD-IC family P-type ATPase n=1 Tax=Roseburia sp. MSJ-14 TaxID=2841514 RepID=UPI001C101C52|nr:HAD-IC family P-type ATPase [Roseburia sp. MSJ-14]MBU5473191.1 HAD-IC family P-type ATPase [Roseburia sp. MSJ-14]